MPPRFLTNPAPKTEAARASLKSFYCELCQKGYSRQNEYDAHESSYDHQHKKRLKEMKAMSKDPAAAAKARKAEQKATEKQGGGLIKISLAGSKEGKDGGPGAAGSEGGFKKGGFKSAFGKTEVGVEVKKEDVEKGHVEGIAVDDSIDLDRETDTEDEGEDCYDPKRPTGCGSDCKGRR